jgi:hypothetical protein
MQIASASLLAAQQQASIQQKPQNSVFGSFLSAPDARPKEAAKTQFEPVEFASKETPNTAPAAQPEPLQAYRPPGSALDIRV